MAKLNLWLAAAFVCGTWSSAFAQNAISAKAGLVQVADGEVFVNGQAVEHKVAQFTDLKSKDILTTAEGRAEVLLTPGAFLRMTDSSGIRMVSTRLSDVRMEMVEGESIVEVAELLSDNSIAMTVGTASFELHKGGIYQFNATPGRIRVYQGEALATQGEKTVTVKAGHEFASDGTAWTLNHFDTKETDALYRWSSRRSGNIAVANVSAARQAGNGYGGGYGGYSGMLDPSLYGGMGGMYGAGMYGAGMYGAGMYGAGMYGAGMYGAGGSWMFNPYFGMYTFMPFGGTAWSPFGYAYYTPVTVGQVYAYAPRQPVNPIGPPTGRGVGVPRVPGEAVRSLTGRVSPAFTTNAALHSGAITRGLVTGASRSGFYGGSGHYSGGYSSPSYAGNSTNVSPSISAAPSRGGGGGGGAPMSGGGGGGATRGH